MAFRRSHGRPGKVAIKKKEKKCKKENNWFSFLFLYTSLKHAVQDVCVNSLHISAIGIFYIEIDRKPSIYLISFVYVTYI